jgi:PAT family beta-lactamase induction signal transducer AmpG
MTESSQTSTSPTSADVVIKPKRSWSQAFKVYAQPTSLRMLALGFGRPAAAAGAGHLSFWLREADIDRTTIGFLSWVGLAYAFKWVWSPLVDRCPAAADAHAGAAPRLAAVFAAADRGGPARHVVHGPQAVPAAAGVVRCWWLSARPRRILRWMPIASSPPGRRPGRPGGHLPDRLPPGHDLGRRRRAVGGGAGAGDVQGYMVQAWHVAYTAMAASMLVGMITVLLSPEPEPVPGTGAQCGRVDAGRVDCTVCRLHRPLPLAGAAAAGADRLYRISDVVMGIMANPFYVDMGYTKEEVAAVTKVFGVIMTLLGAFVGGTMAMRWGVMRVLMLGAVLSACTNLLFAWLATRGHDVTALVWVVSADNLAGGIASAAFIAYLSGLTNVQYSATQYALFSSMMLLAPKWLAGFSGRLSMLMATRLLPHHGADGLPRAAADFPGIQSENGSDA